MNIDLNRLNTSCFDIIFKHRWHICKYRQRDREPRRIPGKKISRLLTKSKNIRKLVRKQIKRNVPRSSHIHRFVFAYSHERKRLLNGQAIYSPVFDKYVRNRARYSQHSQARQKGCSRLPIYRSYEANIQQTIKSSDFMTKSSGTFKNLNLKLGWH